MSGDVSEFTPKQIHYIQTRASEDTNAAAYRRSGYTRNQWYHLSQELRDRLNEEAFKLASDAKMRAVEIYQEEMAQAAARVIMLAKSADSDAVKLRANLDILERGGFREKRLLDVTSGDEPIGITIDK